MEQSIEDILKTIDDAVNKFQGKIPGIQKAVFDELQPLVKAIEVKNGRLVNNLNNLRLIQSIKNKLQRVIVTAEYKQAVTDFVNTYNTISQLSAAYFKQFNKDLSPSNTLPLIKQGAIESTINGLLGEGLSSQVLAPIKSIFSQNITTGGSYAVFNEQLRNYIVGTGQGGALEQHTRTITTDAINEFNAQYHETLSQDLNFNWGRYVGSLITTSREFCVLLTAKEWVHKTELPEIVAGNIDGNKCELNKRTGLPLGMKPDTNADNFKVRRGGWNCGHQFFWVPDNAVPAEIRMKYHAGYNDLFRSPEALKENTDKLISGSDQKTSDGRAAFDTQALFKEPGTDQYTEARKQLHKYIIADYLKNGSTTSGTSYFTGGAPATGKGFLVKMLEEKNKGILVIDPDKIKMEYLPEFEALSAKGVGNAAEMVHEESSALAKMIVKTTAANGWDTVYDGVGDGSYKGVEAKVLQQRAIGKRVVADYATTDVETSVQRAISRGIKTGRNVPEEYIRSMHKEISILFPQFLKNRLFDEINLWNTNVQPATKILSQVNGKLTIYDQAAYDRFLAQGR